MSCANLYALLGCDASATTDQILAEYRAKVREIHPDKMEASLKTEAENLFHELNFAKEILCHFSKRQHYDLFLRMGESLNISLKEWMENQDRLQQTLHWANQTTEVMPMLESLSLNTPSTCKFELDQTGSLIEEEGTSFKGPHKISVFYPRRFEGWTSHNSPVINAFRNYEI